MCVCVLVSVSAAALVFLADSFLEWITLFAFIPFASNLPKGGVCGCVKTKNLHFVQPRNGVFFFFFICDTMRRQGF